MLSIDGVGRIVRVVSVDGVGLAFCFCCQPLKTSIIEEKVLTFVRSSGLSCLILSFVRLLDFL